MAAIDSLISITLTETANAVPTVSTTIPLLLANGSPGWAEGDLVHSYGSADELLTDGFSASSLEYVSALALTAQKAIPSEFLVARRSGAQSAGKPAIARVSVTTAAPSHLYSLTLNGKLYSYTSGATDSATTIVAGLKSSVDADAQAICTAAVDTATSKLTLTGTTDGLAFAFTAVDSDLEVDDIQDAAAAVSETLSVDDLVAIQNQNDSWYGLVLVGATDEEIMTAAGWVQSRRKMLFPSSATAALSDADSTVDLLAKLKSGNYNRTALMVTPGSALLGINAAWVGGQLPKTPGSNNWAYATLVGQQPDSFTTAQRSTLIGSPINAVEGKNGNIYTTVMGVDAVQMGTVASGDFVDNVIGLDWLYFNIQSAMFQALVGADGKVPMTDAGVAILASALQSVLDRGADNDLLDKAQTKVLPGKVASLTAAQRKARKAPVLAFSTVLKGAINAVPVTGNISF